MKKTVHLTPPLLTSSSIKEKISCIRAHRERIFNVSIQSLQDKIIVHNYGHGGAGWTFLFGCVNEAIRKFEILDLPKNRSIAVIGAGCYGILTAIILAQKGYNPCILAKELIDISSFKAAGFFFPRARKCSTQEERAIFESVGLDSYRNYLQIAQGYHPFIAKGATVIPHYYGMDINPGFDIYIKNQLIEPPEQIRIRFNESKFYEAMQYNAIFINAEYLMRELKRNQEELGIPIKQTEIADFFEISESIIFNCAGLGAKNLTQDAKIIPVQGHLITLANQPFIEQMQYMTNFKVLQQNLSGNYRDELIYFAPKGNGILGITFLRNQDCPDKNQHEFDRLLQRSIDFFGI